MTAAKRARKSRPRPALARTKARARPTTVDVKRSSASSRQLLTEKFYRPSPGSSPGARRRPQGPWARRPQRRETPHPHDGAYRMDKVSDLVRQRAAAFDRFKALADQETLSNEERKSYAAEKEAVIALDDRITRAREAQAAAAATAQPVEGQQRAVPAAAKTDRYEKEPSLVIGGVVKMLGIGGGNIYAARQAATDLYGEAHPVTRALVVSVGSSGGFIVPPDYVAEIIELLRPRAQVRSAGPRVIPM